MGVPNFETHMGDANDHQWPPAITWSRRPGSTPDLRNLTLHTLAKGADVFCVCCVQLESAACCFLKMWWVCISWQKLPSAVLPKGLKIKSLQGTQLGPRHYPLMVWCLQFPSFLRGGDIAMCLGSLGGLTSSPVSAVCPPGRPMPCHWTTSMSRRVMAELWLGSCLEKIMEIKLRLSPYLLWQFWSNFFMFIVFADMIIQAGIVDVGAGIVGVKEWMACSIWLSIVAIQDGQGDSLLPKVGSYTKKHSSQRTYFLKTWGCPSFRIFGCFSKYKHIRCSEILDLLFKQFKSTAFVPSKQQQQTQQTTKVQWDP